MDSSNEARPRGPRLARPGPLLDVLPTQEAGPRRLSARKARGAPAELWRPVPLPGQPFRSNVLLDPRSTAAPSQGIPPAILGPSRGPLSPMASSSHSFRLPRHHRPGPLGDGPLRPQPPLASPGPITGRSLGQAALPGLRVGAAGSRLGDAPADAGPWEDWEGRVFMGLGPRRNFQVYLRCGRTGIPGGGST